jgi:hypothetical protein
MMPLRNGRKSMMQTNERVPAIKVIAPLINPTLTLLPSLTLLENGHHHQQRNATVVSLVVNRCIGFDDVSCELTIDPHQLAMLLSKLLRRILQLPACELELQAPSIKLPLLSFDNKLLEPLVHWSHPCKNDYLSGSPHPGGPWAHVFRVCLCFLFS